MIKSLWNKRRIEKFNKNYANEHEEKNILLSEKLKLSYAENGLSNVLVYGPAGSGMSCCCIEPNIENMDSNMIIIDVNNCYYYQYVRSLKEKGFRVDTISFSHSSPCSYNPFVYFHSDKDVKRFAASFHYNLRKREMGEKFYVLSYLNAEKALITAVFLYVYHNVHSNEQKNLNTVIQMLIKNKEDASGTWSLDHLFSNLKLKSPDDSAVLEYNRFRERISSLEYKKLMSQLLFLLYVYAYNKKEVLSKDTLDLESFRSDKRVLFITFRDLYSSEEYVMAAVLLAHMYDIFERNVNGVNGRHIQFILDYVDAVGDPGVIYNFSDYLEKRFFVNSNVSTIVAVKSMAQLAMLFDGNMSIYEIMDLFPIHLLLGRNISSFENKTISNYYDISLKEMFQLKRDECYVFLNEYNLSLSKKAFKKLKDNKISAHVS